MKVDTRLGFRIGRFGSALPMLFFVVWAVVICLKGAPDTRGLILGVIIGLILAMFFVKGSWSQYCQAIFDGMAQPVGVVAIVCWLWAGMFAQVLRAGGLVEGLIWLGKITGVTGSLFVGATFLLSATFATAVGTGYGTTLTFCNIMFPAGLIVGANPVAMLGAILSGAAFGDNLAPVSDTTIVSAVTQETDVPGVVRSRFKYAITAAIPAFILFLIFGGATKGIGLDPALAKELMEKSTDPSGLLLLIPFALVIFLAMRGNHIVVSLTWGIITASLLIIIFGLGTPRDIFYIDTKARVAGGALVEGIAGYVEMCVLILLIVAAGYIMQVGGAMDGIKNWILSRVKASVARAELSMCSIVASLNFFITVNTAAEIAAAPFVREVGRSFKLHPYRRANFLDAVSSALGYIFPWSGGVLIGYFTLLAVKRDLDWLILVSPTQVWPYVFHGWLLVGVMFMAALSGFGRIYEAPDGKPVKERPEGMPVSLS